MASSSHKLDKLVNPLVAPFLAYFLIASDPLQLIKNGVLGFLFPVVEEYILK